MTVEATPTPAAAPAPLPTAAPDGSVESVISMAEQLLGGETPAAPAEQATPAPEGETATPTAAPESDGIELPRISEIEKIARERAEQRAAREAQEAPIKAVRELQQQVETLTSALLTPEALADPERAEQALAKAGVDVDRLIRGLAERRLKRPAGALPSALEAKLDSLEKKLEQLGQPPPAPAGPRMSHEQIEQTKDLFAEYVQGARELYPRAAALPASVVKAAGWDYLARLAKAGYDTSQITDAAIAKAIERELAPGPIDAPATGGDQAPGPQSAAIGSEAANQTTSAPRSVSPGLAADAPRTPPTSEKARVDDAIAFARSLGIGA